MMGWEKLAFLIYFTWWRSFEIGMNVDRFTVLNLIFFENVEKKKKKLEQSINSNQQFKFPAKWKNAIINTRMVNIFANQSSQNPFFLSSCIRTPSNYFPTPVRVHLTARISFKSPARNYRSFPSINRGNASRQFIKRGSKGRIVMG